MTQSEALSILKTGSNVFVTGEPGSGKTHTVNEYVAYLHQRGIEPAITVSTGIAATHIGGMTIHSWSGIGIKSKLSRSDLHAIASSKPIAKRVRRVKVLIIDEVSMLAAETLAMVDAVCREIKESPEPFGGMQVVLVGDFFQLPPIVKPEIGHDSPILFIEESSARFAYDSPAWKGANLTVCYLTEQHRQDDVEFLAVLSAIRRNAFGADHLRRLTSRTVQHHDAPKAAPKLFSHNVDVDRVNDGILAQLPGEPRVYPMTSQGPDVLVAALKKGCLSPETLRLKVGAAVVFTKNNLKEGFVNGTLGVVEEFDRQFNHPIVRTRSGRRVGVEPMDWMVEENGTVRACMTQVPLRLAWAITVHKSQGMSLDEAVMDLREVFEFGQGYIALSRIRRLSGLHLLGWTERAFQVHPDVLAKDAELRALSEQAARTFGRITGNEMMAGHERFLRLCGGTIHINEPMTRETPPVSGFGIIRARHPNAYLPWDKTQDEQLRILFAQGPSVASLAHTLNRTRGAIRSRLAKLGLVDKG
jgi:ATP-dependent exoDNAse (exonuclease V) alpha subunit